MQLASESQGCSVVSATSNDLVHLPSSILANERSGDSNDNFWMSTGSFPQEIVIQLGAASSIKSVDIVSLGVRKIQLDKCDGPQANRSTNKYFDGTQLSECPFAFCTTKCLFIISKLISCT